jgi:phage shock protein A
MRRALGKLDRELSALEAKARGCEDEARRMLKAGNRTRAMQMLRQKKILERQVVEKDKVYTNMAELIHKVEQAADQKQVGVIARGGTVYLELS